MEKLKERNKKDEKDDSHFPRASVTSLIFIYSLKNQKMLEYVAANSNLVAPCMQWYGLPENIETLDCIQSLPSSFLVSAVRMFL